MRWAREPAPARRVASAATFANGRAIVGLSAGASPTAFARDNRLRLVWNLPGLRAAELAGAPHALASLTARRDDRVRYVEPLGRFELAHVRNDPLTYEVDPQSGVPYEWGFHQIEADQALNLGKGDPNILVGVVDTGVSAVTDLRGKLAKRLWDASTTTSANDVEGHGTAIASIIAANNDDGVGLAGFCGACRLAVYKAFPMNEVEFAEGLKGLTDAHVRIINLSIVGQSSDLVIDALNYALAAGVLVVAASGNDGSSTVSFPASYLQAAGGQASGGIVVGATDAKGNLASFSNRGSQVSMVAPGAYTASCALGIIGAIPAISLSFDTGVGCDATLFNAHNERYAYANGTSFAAPEVAGVAALVWAARPQLTSVQVADVLEQTATRPTGVGWRTNMGWGILDAKAALENVTGRSSADSLHLAGLRVRGRRSPGQKLTAVSTVTWGDGSRVAVGALPACRITVGARATRSTASLVSGVLGCSFRLPAASAGAHVRGSLLLSSAAAPTVTVRFALTIVKPA
jgi:subtilisin family serine protease